jgi:hypothetical protein
MEIPSKQLVPNHPPMLRPKSYDFSRRNEVEGRGNPKLGFWEVFGEDEE